MLVELTAPTRSTCERQELLREEPASRRPQGPRGPGRSGRRLRLYGAAEGRSAVGLPADSEASWDTRDEDKNKLLVPDGFYYILTQFMMTSKVEKTHALQQCFSTESLICSLGLGIFCLVADRLLRFSILQQNDWLRALSDNIVHGVIGMWSWAVVIGIKKKADFGEVLLAGFLASVIDIDHFFLARSLSLKAALTLPRRPFLHCSTVIPIAVVSVKLVMYLFRLRDSWCFLPWMLFISWASHHIRDGIRHGLWICPFGKTSPLPFWLYVITTLSLPHMCSFLMYLSGTRQMSSKHGTHIDV